MAQRKKVSFETVVEIETSKLTRKATSYPYPLSLVGQIQVRKTTTQSCS